MMLGILLTLWCVPTMSLGHLLLAVLMTAYVLVGVHMEERSLLRRLGEDYRRYWQSTPMLIPIPLSWRRRRPRAAEPLATEGSA